MQVASVILAVSSTDVNAVWACKQVGSTQCRGKAVKYVQMAGQVASQLWEEWQSEAVEADVFNVNVPLGFKTVEGTPVKPEILHTTVDMQSQYSSLYSELRCPTACLYCCYCIHCLSCCAGLPVAEPTFALIQYCIVRCSAFAQ